MAWRPDRCAAGAVVLLLSSRALLACVCEETVSVADELRSSGAVFVGRVVSLSIEAVPLEQVTAERTVATFQVERSWKGPKRSKVDVWTCGDQVSFCTCGVGFKLGERYLVFAEGTPLGTSSCSRTRVAAEAESIVAELDRLPAATKSVRRKPGSDTK